MKRTIRFQLETQEVIANFCPKCGANLEAPSTANPSLLRRFLDFVQTLRDRQRQRRLP